MTDRVRQNGLDLLLLVSGLSTMTFFALSGVEALRIVTMPMVLALPGLAIWLALFSRPLRDVDAEALGLSCILSIAAVICVCLALDVLSVHLADMPIVCGLDGLSLTALAVWLASTPSGSAASPVASQWRKLKQPVAFATLIVAFCTMVILLTKALPGPAPDPYYQLYLAGKPIPSYVGGKHETRLSLPVALNNQTDTPMKLSLVPTIDGVTFKATPLTVAARTVGSANLAITLTRAECRHVLTINGDESAGRNVRAFITLREPCDRRSL